MLSFATHSPRFIDPLSDFGFKKLFGSEPNKEILIDFLNQLFKGKKVIRDLIFKPIERFGEGKEAKTVYLDLFCTGDEGEQFLVEMQRAEQHYLKERGVFYASRVISEQLPKGKGGWNYALKEVYLIFLLEFDMKGSGEGYLHDYCLMERQTGQVFYEKLEFKFIELPKFTKTESQLETDLDRWLFLLKNLSRLDKIPVFLRKKVFQKVFKIAEIANLTKEERMFYQSKAQIEFDYNNAVAFAAEKLAQELAAERVEKLAGEMAEKLAGEMAEKLAGEMAEKLAGEMAEKLAGEMAEKLAELEELKAGKLAEAKARKLAEAKAEKLAKVKAEKILEAQTEKVIRNMMAKGYSDTEICEILEMAPKYVAAIRKGLK